MFNIGNARRGREMGLDLMLNDREITPHFLSGKKRKENHSRILAISAS
jgi:hypothetical protein